MERKKNTSLSLSEIVM